MNKQAAQFMIERLKNLPGLQLDEALAGLVAYEDGGSPADGISVAASTAIYDCLRNDNWQFLDGTLSEVVEVFELGCYGTCDACGKYNGLKTQDTCGGEGDFCRWGCK